MRAALGKWRRLNLWPRLVIAVTFGFVVLFVIFSFVSLRAVSGSTDRILEERLVVARMAATAIDGLLEGAFDDLESAAHGAPVDPMATSPSETQAILGGRLEARFLGAQLYDADGDLLLSNPPAERSMAETLRQEAHLADVLETGLRGVSAPFVDPLTERPVVALTIPILGLDGTVRAMLSGLLDASSEAVLGPLNEARQLGDTGHAELVDAGNRLIATTEPGGFGRPGEHPEFYVRMTRDRSFGVETVRYVPWHPPAENVETEDHVMAFAPLEAAPWGVGVGGNESETFAAVGRLRNTLLAAGALALVSLWGITLLGARLLVHPVQALTAAAKDMAEGDLDRSVTIGEGGEIGMLGESLDAMRTQLRESLDKIRRWGEDLDAQVHERTEELTTRNRQLAAITAVATASARVQSVDKVLGRCLDAALENTEMEAGAVRLLDPQSNRFVVVAVREDGVGFRCQAASVAIGECACTSVASSKTPLYLDAAARRRFATRCRVPKTGTLAILPLASSKETLGILYLVRRSGNPPDGAERRILTAISDQIGVAAENVHLHTELREMEARTEVQRVKAEFISTVSHELRTPLGFIRGYATTLLRDDMAPFEADTQREFLEIIDEEAAKLQKMIDELLDASQLQAGRLSIETVPTFVGDLVGGTLAKTEAVLVQMGHPIEVELPNEDLKVMADPVRVEQVLHNLLHNAAGYSEPGTPVSVAVGAKDGHVQVSVADRGDGILDGEQESIFEPFYRGENAARRTVQGTGLGLAICRGIIEAHGGKIWVESVPGQGSTFLFTLSLAEGLEAN